MEETKTLTVTNSDEHPPQSKYPPLISSYNSQIRPVLDAIDDLRHLNIMKEGIQLPTIVVVGDQSSGKSSVLESLAGINLPRGQGICTRVPLIMRLQHHHNLTPNLCLEYLNNSVDTDEQNVAESIESATLEIAGSGKGITRTPLTLVVKKNGVPDLTMVDLPGITRVAVQGQPENIYEQIHDIIMEYITPEESIILNVLSAAVDFSTCESIRMSQKVDKSGKRTLAVVTKADKAPEGLLEKVTTDDVQIGLGYVCVRNRIGDETYVEARAEEVSLFQSHPQLSIIEKSMVGVPVLAEKLTTIQASSIARCLPRIVKQINDKLNSSIAELNKLPSSLSSPAEAMTAFMKIQGSSKESLRKILVRGEYEEYPDDKEMHCTARLAEFLNDFSCKLMDKERVDRDDVNEDFLVEEIRVLEAKGYDEEVHCTVHPAEFLNDFSCKPMDKDRVDRDDVNEDFLVEEIRVLEEAKGIGLPNFVPRAAFLNIMQNKINQISVIPEDFACKVWDYVEKIVLTVLGQHSENYPQLASSTRRAAQNMILKMKGQSLSRVKEIIEMEKVADYTCSPEYMVKCNNLMENLAEFTRTVNDTRKMSMEIEGIGEVAVHHLRKFENILQPAFEMKMRVTAYWNIVLRRLVDFMALHLLLCIHNLVDKELESEIIDELMGGPAHGSGIERFLEESPAVAGKREKLRKSVELLKKSKDKFANIMDRIAVTTSS